MKVYRLESPAVYWLFLATPLFFVVIGGMWIYLTATQPTEGPPVWFGILWLAFVLLGSYQLVRMPERIELTDAGLIRFVGMFRDTTVNPHDVISVRGFAGNLVDVKHRHGKIRLLHQFTGFHELLTELKRVNPDVKIRGC